MGVLWASPAFLPHLSHGVEVPESRIHNRTVEQLVFTLLISPINSIVLSIVLAILPRIVACPINPHSDRAIPANAKPP
jgi:hypothetical protein